MKIFPVVIVLTALMLANCGKHTPKTIPPEPKTETGTLERFQQPRETETPEPTGKTTPVETTEIPVQTETPAQTPKPESIPVLKPQSIADPTFDHITAGITGIFKEFGYSGELDVPENFKRRVAYYIRYFSAHEKGSRFYRRAMNRGFHYLPMIREALKRKKLPLSLAYLPVVESGFNPDAHSRAGAVGMWQFMKSTARLYDLKVSHRRDDRKDPIKSTYAAAEYLNDLLAMFGLEDPFLGICAYNAGEGKILRALREISYTERSFWTLVRKNLLRTETNDYIPQFMAVILMNNDPETYVAASKIVPVEPDDEEDREIIDALHIRPDDPADSDADSPPASPETVTPPSHDRSLSPQRVYKVKPGDTLYSIARSFNTSVGNVKQWNNLRGNRIHPGQALTLSPGAGKNGSVVRNSRDSNGKPYKLLYTVNYKDTLVRIALFFKGVSVRDIMRWNGLKRSRIYPKQKLAVYLNRPPVKVATHVIKRGDTAGKIARQYGRPLEYVLALNGLVSTSKLKPGDRLKIYYF